MEAGLEKEVRDAFASEVQHLHLQQIDDHQLLVAACVKKAKPDLGSRLIDFFTARDLSLIPVLFTEHEWQQLDDSAPDGWVDCLLPNQQRIRQTQLHKERGVRHLRRFLLREIRSHRSVLDFALRSEQLPVALSLRICANVVNDTLALLLATRDVAFSGDHTAIASFDEHFTDTGFFSAEEARLPAELDGLSRRAEILTQMSPEVRFDWLPLLKRAQRFLGNCKRYVSGVFVSDKERKQRRRNRIVGASGLGALGLAAVVWWIASLFPISPIGNSALITKPGGISATYFNGRRFQKRVLTRTEDRISLSARGSPAPKVTHDNFSVRWEGYIFFAEAGRYYLCTECDDGARLFFNGDELIDDWEIHGLNRTCATVRVKKGWYPIKAEHFDASKGATMRLLRGFEEKRVFVVPAPHLCCRSDKEPAKRSANKAAIRKQPPVKPIPKISKISAKANKVAPVKPAPKNRPAKRPPKRPSPKRPATKSATPSSQP